MLPGLTGKQVFAEEVPTRAIMLRGAVSQISIGPAAR